MAKMRSPLELAGSQDPAAYHLEEVYPNDLRFTQDSISRYTHFNGKKYLLTELLEMLKSGELKPSDFVLLDVYRDENKVVWSNDNRRLWLFRKANIKEQIQVKVYSEKLKRAPPKDEKDRAEWSKADYFPRVRGESEMGGPLDEEWEDP